MLDGKKTRAKSPLDGAAPDDTENPEAGSEKAKGPLVSRRNFLAACLAGASAMLLWPRAAKADGYDVGGGWFGSAGNWAILKHGNGNWIGSKSGWFSWVCGHHQWIGVAAGLWVEAQYSNELYDAFHMQPLAACRDWNDQSNHRLWRSKYRDTRLQYWCDGGKTEDHGWALSNEDLHDGYGGWWATGLRNFGYEGKDFFFRRQRETSSHGFGLSAGFYNVSVGEYAGGLWDDWENCYVWIHTNGGYSCADWNYQGAAFENAGGVCPGDIKAGQDRCRLENRWDLFGGAWKVTNACANGNGQCLDVCGGGTSSGTYLWSWNYFGATSQVWYANAGGVDSIGRGHMHSLYPAHQPVLGLGEPAGMNGPSTSSTTGYNARVYTQWSGATWNGYSERQFWIGGSTDASYAHSYVTCDATGRNLDLSGGKAANQADVQFHSNGYDDQWDNRAHQWDFDEVRFAGSIEMPEEYKVGGDPVRCSDPAATCRPYDAFGTGQTPYIYQFMTTDSPKSVEEDGARVVGAYMRNGWGQAGLDGKLGIDRGIPAYRYIGLPHEMQSDEQRVTDFALWIESTAFSGSLECIAHLAGGGTLSGSFPVMPAGHQGGAAPSRALTRGGEEPTIGAGTCASETFRQSLSGGSVSAVTLDGSDGVWPAGSRALRLTSNGSAEQVGIAQDKCATVPGSEYTQTAWVRASRDGVSFDLLPIWRSADDDLNEMTFEATTEWQRFTASATASEGSYSAGYVYINGTDRSSNASGDWIEVRCIEVSTPADARSITRGGIEPSMGSGSWHSGTFRESDAAGSVSAVTLDSGNGMWPAGSRALRLTSNGSAGQMGIAQDGCATVPGSEYTQTAWVRASRDGVSFDLLPIWRSADDDLNEMTFEATTEWQRFTASATASEGSYSAGYVYINGSDRSSNADGDWIEVRGIEVTEGQDGAELFPGYSAEWLNGRSSETDIVGVEFWLEGEIAGHYDLDYRAYNRVGHWSAHRYSDGEGNHPAAGDMATSMGSFQVHMVPKPAGAKVVREWSTDPEYTPTMDDSGKYLHCLCRLSAVQPTAASSAAAGGDYGDHDWMLDRFQGTVASAAPTLVLGNLRIKYYVDGESEPCYTDQALPNAVYETPAAAKAAAQKEGCLEVSGWFVDPEYATPYTPRELTGDLELYAYNSCSLEYGTTSRSCVLDASYRWKADEAMTRDLDLAALYPAKSVVRYGEAVTFAGPWSAWCSDMGATRKATSTPGVYSTRSASGSPLLKAAVKKNATVFVDWPWAGYDGVASAW